MKEFFSLNLIHKKFKSLEDIFIFDNIDDFCHFAFKFYNDGCWNIGRNTNTKNIYNYIEFLNTNPDRKYLIYSDVFNSINDVDEYYSNYFDSLDMTVLDYIDTQKKFENDDADMIFDDIDEDLYHYLYFYDSNGERYEKKFTHIDYLELFLNAIISSKYPIDSINIKINPSNVEFDRYFEIVKKVYPNAIIDSNVTSSYELNEYFLSINALKEVEDYIENH